MDEEKKLIKIKTDDSIKMPSECEKSEQEIQSMSDESVVSHYAFINLLVIAVIGLIAAVFFITLTDQKVDDSQNALTLKSFASGKYSSNLQKNYVKNIPFQYELKNIENRLHFVCGIGNELKTYEKPKEIVLISDEDIEQQKQQVKENEEKALNDDKKKTTTKAATKAKTTTKRSTTTAQSLITVKPKTTTSFQSVVSQETTSMTTTNNDPPEITTTTPPIDARES